MTYLVSGIIGGVIGTMVLMATGILPDFETPKFHEDPPIVIYPPIAAAIAATAGFNLTRRYKSPPASEAALINLSDGQMSLAVPTIYFRPNPFDGRSLSQSVDLVKVKF